MALPPEPQKIEKITGRFVGNERILSRTVDVFVVDTNQRDFLPRKLFL